MPSCSLPLPAGLVPLLGNLSRSFDAELMELRHFRDDLPTWLAVGPAARAPPLPRLLPLLRLILRPL